MQSSKPPVTSSILGPNIHLNTQFSDSLIMNIRDQFQSRTNQQHIRLFCVLCSLFFWKANCKTNYSAPNYIKQSLTSICHFTILSVTWTHKFSRCGFIIKTNPVFRVKFSEPTAFAASPSDQWHFSEQNQE